MSTEARWVAYYLAQQKVMLAERDAYAVNPLYDGDEATRAVKIAEYEKLAASYVCMANYSEENA